MGDIVTPEQLRDRARECLYGALERIGEGKFLHYEVLKELVRLADPGRDRRVDQMQGVIQTFLRETGSLTGADFTEPPFVGGDAFDEWRSVARARSKLAAAFSDLGGPR